MSTLTPTKKPRAAAKPKAKTPSRSPKAAKRTPASVEAPAASALAPVPAEAEVRAAIALLTGTAAPAPLPAMPAEIAAHPKSALGWPAMAIWNRMVDDQVGKDFHATPDAEILAFRDDLQRHGVAGLPTGEAVAAALADLRGCTDVQVTAEVEAPAPADVSAPVGLRLGSDIELARVLIDTMRTQYHGHLAYDGGKLYGWTGTHWEPIRNADVRKCIHAFDGSIYGYSKGGEPKVVKLAKGRVDSILYEASAMLDTEEGFFAGAPDGVNVQNGFLKLDQVAGATLMPHAPDLRQRYILPGTWNAEAFDALEDSIPPEDSLLHTLLEGVFRGDDDAAEKAGLIQEIAGVAISGHSTRLAQPKFFLFNGPTANNGKSQVINLIGGLLPKEALSAVSVERWNDDSYRVQLRDTRLNAVGELSGTSIKSDIFKQVITGDEIAARDLYKSVVFFRPVALHVAATNRLPTFEGGFDRGIVRRLCPIDFNRTIPEGEQVKSIGQRIGIEESDLLLAWAVRGALRVLAQGDYSVPESSRTALDEWSQQSDPILGWAAACLATSSETTHADFPGDRVHPEADTVSATSAFTAFVEWCKAEGFKENLLPGKKSFSQRLQTFAAAKVHKATGTHYAGLRVIPGGKPAFPKARPRATAVAAEQPAEDAAPAALKVVPAHKQAHWHHPEPDQNGYMPVMGNTALDRGRPPTWGDAIDSDIPY